MSHRPGLLRHAAATAHFIVHAPSAVTVRSCTPAPITVTLGGRSEGFPQNIGGVVSRSHEVIGKANPSDNRFPPLGCGAPGVPQPSRTVTVRL